MVLVFMEFFVHDHEITFFLGGQGKCLVVICQNLNTPYSNFPMQIPQYGVTNVGLWPLNVWVNCHLKNGMCVCIFLGHE